MSAITQPNTLAHEALIAAERFISGFEGDESQAGVGELLSVIRAAIADGQDVAGTPIGPVELLARVNRDLANLRATLEEPQVLTYSPNVLLEVAPTGCDNRINVCHHLGSWATVNYAADGLIVDIFNDTDVEPISELAFTYDELLIQESV